MLKPYGGLLAALLLLGCALSACGGDSSAAPQAVEPSETAVPESVLAASSGGTAPDGIPVDLTGFTQAAYDESDLGDQKIRIALSEAQQRELLALLRADAWAPAAELPEYGLDSALVVVNEGEACWLSVSPWNEEHCLVGIFFGTGEERSVYYAPPETAADAAAFSKTLRGE